MNRNFTRLASILMCAAFGHLSMVGQETVVMKTGIGEHLLNQGVQLRAGETLPANSTVTYDISDVQLRASLSTWPDSVIGYTETGQKESKYVYTYDSNENVSSIGFYQWRYNQWLYNRDVGNVWELLDALPSYTKAFYETGDNWVWFNVPAGIRGVIWFGAVDMDGNLPSFETGYDSSGNLILFELWGARYIMEYNVSGQIVSMKRYSTSRDEILYTITYTYSDRGQLVYVEGKQALSKPNGGGTGDGPLVDNVKEINQYDEEGRLVSTQHYMADNETGNWLSDEFQCYKIKCKYDNNGNRTAVYTYSWSTGFNRWSLLRQTISYPNDLTPSVDTGDNDPVDDTNKGKFDVIINLPIDSIADGSFVIKLPDGFRLDETNTRLSIDFGDFTLSITKQEDNSWLLEIKPKNTRSAALRSEDVSRALAHIAYTVNSQVKRGTYDITVHSILFETPGGDAIVEPALTVPVQLNRWGVGNETIVPPTIWSHDNTLHIRTPQPATLKIYTLTGALFRQQTLPAGETAIPLPPGTYLVQIEKTVKKILIR